MPTPGVAPNDFYDGGFEVPESVIGFVDENVLAKLPEGTKVKGVYPHGASYWTRTAEIATEQADGSSLSFFLKVAQNDTGKGMVSGELESMKAIHTTMPEIAPRPIAWGTYKSIPETYFFICEFIEMTDEVPSIMALPAKVAEFHRRGKSPNGKFGFHIRNFQGSLPQEVAWTDTWEECFTNNLRGMYELEQKSQGADPEMAKLAEALFSKVIPRLLRPLETGGRSIKPSLVHGDLWGGNVSSSVESGEPIIFDASSLYGHNEYDLGGWRPNCFNIGKSYIKAYHRHYPVAAPAADQDDRNVLYCIRFEMCSSALYPGNLRFRKMIVEEMKYLVEKYPDGYEGWEKQQRESEASTVIKSQESVEVVEAPIAQPVVSA